MSLKDEPPYKTDQIINFNVGGQKFATSVNTLTWIPDTFFTSLISGRIPSVRDESGAIFIDRDPDLFRVILNYLRTKQIDLSSYPVHILRLEAQFFNLCPLVRRLLLCDELEVSSCGSLLFHGSIPLPGLLFLDYKLEEGLPQGESRGGLRDNLNDFEPSETSQDSCNSKITDSSLRKGSMDQNRYARAEIAQLRQQMRSSLYDPISVRIVRAHYNTVAVAHSYYACVYRMNKKYTGWKAIFTSSHMEYVINHLAWNTKFGAQSNEKMLAIALANGTIHLWSISEEENRKKGSFTLGVQVDKLFFIGSQMVALSRSGKVGIWQSVTQNWQVQELVPVTCYDTAGSSLLLGCSNGSMYHIDMQKFPLRMKDNDLLITELYKDPNRESITALSVYLTPKTNSCGNWIEIAYGTSSGVVRIIVQHPETVGHGPQLFQSYTVHNSPITHVSLSTSHLISVCSDYNHVRTWAVTRFRGMISTQPGNTNLASFKVLTLDSTDEFAEKDYTDVGPYGDQEGEQVFVQRVVPDSNQVFIRLASTGERICTIKTVDGSAITSFVVHECESSSRLGSRPRKFLFCGTNTGAVQIWDLSTAIDQINKQASALPLNCPPQSQTQLYSEREQPMKANLSSSRYFSASQQIAHGPTPQELLQLIDECDISCNSINNTPSSSHMNLTGFDFSK
ncbi:unnamed protein product [Auanema sp. JU1783]|nr:unnamed protein product [Auanema sp. JU1783]